MTVIAVFEDWKEYRIANRLSVCGLGAAVVCMILEVFVGGDVTEEITAGIGVFVVLYLIYMIGGVGAGDVKLLAVIGFLLGRVAVRIAVMAFAVAAMLGIAGILLRKLEKRKVRVLDCGAAELHIMHFSIAILSAELLAVCMCIV